MVDAYRVPKRKVPVTVTFPGKPAVQVKIFLGDCAQTHAGNERPSDLLNGSDSFFPATDTQDGIMFIHRDALNLLSVNAGIEFHEEVFRAETVATRQSARIDVEVELEDGTRIEGIISYLMPENQRRLQDVLNLEDRFLILRDGDEALLINKRRIARIAPKPVQVQETAVGED